MKILPCAILTMLLLIGCAFAAVFDATQYQYMSSINVLCEEYKGYAQFEMPAEYLALASPRAYINATQLYIASASSYDTQLSNWYVKDTSGLVAAGIESAYDNNYASTYLVNGKQDLSLQFTNPASQTVSKISVDLKNSQLTSAEVIVNGKAVATTLSQSAFRYEVTLATPVNMNLVTLNLRFDTAAQIREIAFFNKIAAQKTYGYVYVNNNCADTFTLYFGVYGESNSNYGAQYPPVSFQATVYTRSNLAYNNDFDNDTISNAVDNCMLISNLDQKDINYNKIGDSCEDDDRDGRSNAIDNCIEKYNYDQFDVDKDGIGDACDESDDRFTEKNANFIYLIAGLIVIAFLFFAIKIAKEQKK